MSRDIEFTYSPTEHHLRRLQLKQSKSQLSHFAARKQFTTEISKLQILKKKKESQLVRAAQQELLSLHLFIQVM